MCDPLTKRAVSECFCDDDVGAIKCPLPLLLHTLRRRSTSELQHSIAACNSVSASTRDDGADSAVDGSDDGR